MDKDLAALLYLCDAMTRKFGLSPSKTAEILNRFCGIEMELSISEDLPMLDEFEGFVGHYLEVEREAHATGKTIDEVIDNDNTVWELAPDKPEPSPLKVVPFLKNEDK